MKRKIISSLLLFVFILSFAFSNVACAHTHVFDKQKATSEFLLTDATCKTSATYYYSCSCGEKGTETFNGELFKECVFENDVCVNCEQKKPTDGLSYQQLENGTYSVSVGEAKDATDVVIPYSYNGIKVTEIAKNGFKECANLVSVIIPESIESIGRFAFFSCPNLSSINIPSSITVINASTFDSCTSLTSIELPESITTIEVAAFSNSGLKSITIPESVTSIKDSAFRYCTSLKKVIIPIGVTEIKSFAFANIPGLGILCRAKSKPEGWIYNWYYEGMSSAEGLWLDWDYQD